MMKTRFPFASRWLGVNAGGGMAWLEAMPERSVVLLFLLEGQVCLQARPGVASSLHGPNRLLWLNTTLSRPSRLLLTGEGNHSALMLSFPEDWLRQTLGDLGRELSNDMRGLLLGQAHPAQWLERPMEEGDRFWAKALMAPSLCSAARELLEGSRINEFFLRKVLTESKGEELFCSRTRRLALSRVSKVREALAQDLENPPTLTELAQACGCNPQYLSRTFADTAGKTISLTLRELRIRRAAQLLGCGSHNASEASLEVGYRSLSHFSQAFREEMGASPSEWLRTSQPKKANRRSPMTLDRHQRRLG